MPAAPWKQPSRSIPSRATRSITWRWCSSASASTPRGPRPSRRPTRSTPSTTRCPFAWTTSSSDARSRRPSTTCRVRSASTSRTYPCSSRTSHRRSCSATGMYPQILGIYIGTPRTQADQSAQPTDVTRVMLFKRNLEIVRDQDDLVDRCRSRCATRSAIISGCPKRTWSASAWRSGAPIRHLQRRPGRPAARPSADPSR